MFAARMLKPRMGLGRETKIKTGSHPFVELDGEDFLRVGIVSSSGYQKVIQSWLVNSLRSMQVL